MTSIQSTLFLTYLTMFALLAALYGIVFNIFGIAFPDFCIMGMILAAFTLWAMDKTWSEYE